MTLRFKAQLFLSTGKLSLTETDELTLCCPSLSNYTLWQCCLAILSMKVSWTAAMLLLGI